MQCDDGTYTPETKLYNYINNYYDAALAKSGFKLPGLEDVRQKVVNAGFVDVEVKKYKYPWGAWPKDKDLKMLGAVSTVIAETGFEVWKAVGVAD